MADDDTTTTAPPATGYDPALINRIISGLLGNQQQSVTLPQVQMAQGPPVQRSFMSRFGEVAGGGPGNLQGQAAEDAGNRAWSAIAQGLLANSGYHPVRTTFGEAAAAGLAGAQASEAASQGAQFAQYKELQDLADRQQQNQLARLKEVLPLLRLQAGAAIPNLLAGGTPSPAGAPGATAAPGSLPAIPRDPKAGTIGQQGNNPGNLGVDGAPLGATGYLPDATGNKVAVFPDVATGIAATSDRLSSYAARGISTVADAVKTWVGGAVPAGYAEGVAKALGVQPGDKIDLSNPAVQRAFILAQQPHESGKAWLQPADVDKGLALAQARRATAVATPPGGSPTPPQPAPVKVAGPAVGPSVTPPQATPGVDLAPLPVADALAKAKTTGASVPIAGGGGLVAKPDGSIDTPTGTTAPAATPTATPAPTTPPAITPTTTPTTQPPPVVPPPPPVLPTFEEWLAEGHGVKPDFSTVAALERGRDQAAVDRAAAYGGAGGDPDKARQAYITAGEAIAKARQTAINDATGQSRQLYDADMQRRQSDAQKATELAQTVSENEKNRVAALTQERVKAGYTLHQAQQQSDMEEGKAFLTEADNQATQANDMRNLLALIGPNVKSLPSGMVAQVLSDHPNLVNYLRGAGVLSGEQADATQLIRGLTQYASTLMRPKGTGSLRTPEMTAFQSVMPSLLESDAGRQKALAFLQAYNNRIVDEADFAHSYYKRPVASQDPNATAGTQAPAYNIDGLWGAVAKPVEQGGLGDVIPHYHGSMQDGVAYKQWEQGRKSGTPYWGYKVGPGGKLVETLQVAP